MDCHDMKNCMANNHINKEITVTFLDAALPNGWAVAKDDGLVIFVPDGVVGQTAKIRIVKIEKNLAYGEILSVESRSRFESGYPSVSCRICGGCVFRNLNYDKQLEIKKNHLLNTLRNIGKLNDSLSREIKITQSPDTDFYRNKIEFSFGLENGKITLGLMERVNPLRQYGAEIISLEKCYIFNDNIDAVLRPVLGFLNEKSYQPYNLITKAGFLRNFVIRESKKTKELMIILVTTSGEIDGVSELAGILASENPQLKSFYWVINDKPSNMFDYQKEKYISGEKYIEENIGGLRFKIYPKTFFQPNSKGAEILYGKIVELSGLKKNENVLGLYCGCGAIELFVSKYAQKVYGIDSNKVNIISAKENCFLNGITNASFFHGDVDNIMDKLRFKKISLIIVDPPRSGLTKQAIKNILRFSPPKIAYVSCNPSTLCRDLKEFSNMGYHTYQVEAFDLFPHTGHLETLSILKPSKI